MSSRQQRINELNQLAATEGIELSFPAEIIVFMEENGHVVDLITGQVYEGGANDTFSLTVVGEMVAVAIAAWNKVEG